MTNQDALQQCGMLLSRHRRRRRRPAKDVEGPRASAEGRGRRRRRRRGARPKLRLKKIFILAVPSLSFLNAFSHLVLAGKERVGPVPPP